MAGTNRRAFLAQSGLGLGGTALWAATATAASSSPNEQVRLGVIGCGGRGSGVAREFAGERHCIVTQVCDPDADRAGKLADQIGQVEGQPRPRIAKDLREILDSKEVDAVLIATPDHWHAPSAILACDAGKHVYVEKPCSHNVREGRLLVDAARRNQRVVQHGTQSRSSLLVASAIQMLREGIIGDVLVSRAWNVQRRQNIGHAQPTKPPAGFDYDLWLGPAPYVAFQPNRHHYSWHWWYDFGTGDMGNDGVHELDYARWGLGVDTHPSRITGLGGKYFFDDDQQFPDTQQVVFEYPGDDRVGSRRMLIWEMRIWTNNSPYHIDNGVEFHGTKGRLLITKRGTLKVFGEREAEVEAKLKGDAPQHPAHHVNFLDAIRTGTTPTAEIELGHLSASLCHLGNISTRLARTLHFDPGTEQVVGDDEANALLTRDYRSGHWSVPRGV